MAKKASTAKATEITLREKQLAREVWTVIEKDYLAVGTALFKELFTSHPSMTKYFERMKANPEQDIFESARFKTHIVSYLFPSIADLLKKLDFPDQLEEKLKEIGLNHKKRNLRREQFEILHKVFIITFRNTLQEQFTPEKENAWNKILTVIVDSISQYL